MTAATGDDDANSADAPSGAPPPFTRFLNAEGVLDPACPEAARAPEAMIAAYRAMVRTRVFDQKAVALQRTARLGTYASSLGQEAVSVGAALAMQARDVLLPSFREHGAQLVRGVTPVELLLYWGGDERGSNFAGPRADFPVSIPVASQFPHAVGAALAFQQRGEPRVALVFGGDGATSKGDFYEALNIVGVWRLPAVFVISNNQWAISMRREDQTASPTLAEKALAAGVPGEQVDGDDVLAVRHVIGRALERARRGEGGALIECLTYRLGDHTTADDASRYRDDAEVSPHWKEEPIARLRAHLASAGLWDKEREEALLHQCREEIEAAAETYLATSPEPATALFDHLYARLPADLEPQRALAQESAEAGHG